ncbi:MAG: hypothetical protein R3A44_09980 [Caldilineaceae bacterium]
MSTTLTGSRWLRWGLLLLLFAAVFATVLLWRFGAAALTGNQMSRAAPLAKNLTPDELFVELFPANTLEDAANGFAAALGIPPESVMVRLRFSGCSACEMKENALLPDLTVAEAATEIERADAFWLVHNDLICFHLLQNETWMPKSCAVFLSPGRG